MKKILILSLGLLGTLSMQAMEEEEVLLSGEKKKKESQPIFFKKISRLWTRAEKKLDESPYLENQKEGTPLIFFNIKNETGEPFTLLQLQSEQKKVINSGETGCWIADVIWSILSPDQFSGIFTFFLFYGGAYSFNFHYRKKPNEKTETLSASDLEGNVPPASYEGTLKEHTQYNMTLIMKSKDLKDAKLVIKERE